MYERAVAKLIVAAHQIIDLPVPERFSAEGVAKLATWTDVLIRNVPLAELRDAFDYAVDAHDERRLINAMDVKSAYTRMCAERRHAQVDEEGEHLGVPTCSHCRGTGEEPEPIYDMNSGRSFTLPCFYCRQQQAINARARLLGTRAPNVADIARTAEALASEQEQ